MDTASVAESPAAVKMQEPGSPMGSSLSPKPLRRRRQKRTVYSAEQRRELEKFFEGNHYPTYQDRETLAARLSLRENQVQVWFKNRRAKHARLLRLSSPQGGGACAATAGPGACAPAPVSPSVPVPVTVPAPVPAPVSPSVPAPVSPSVPAPVSPSVPAPVSPSVPAPVPAPVSPSVPAPVPAGPVYPGGSVFPGYPVFYGPGFCSPPQPSSFRVFPAAEANVSSHSQAWWDPTQGAQNMVQAAPAPAQAVAPVWPQGTYDSNFSPDSVVTPDFTELLSLQDPSEGSSSFTSGYQEGDDFVDENTCKLLSL